jgi:L-ribulose-5-phosphate 4-epimerase
MLEQLKNDVYNATMLLPKHNIVLLSLGSVSGVDRAQELIVVKPTDISYDSLSPEDMLVIDFNGALVEGKGFPPSDIATHIELYRGFPEVMGITHSYSRFASIFAQMGLSLPPLGTLHADYFHGEIPCTRKLKAFEIRGNYEREIGLVIVERFQKGKLNYNETPGILVYSHNPYTWGDSPMNSAIHAIILEEIAFMAWHCMALPDKYLIPMQKDLMEKHFQKKNTKRSTLLSDK